MLPRDGCRSSTCNPEKSLPSHGDATDHGASFQDQDFFAGFRQIGSRNQPVVSGTDDDRVVILHGELDPYRLPVFQYFQRR